VCSDPERSFYPQREICYATMEREAANAKWEALHKDRPWHNGIWSSWGQERSTGHPYFRDHGVRIGVTADSDLRPTDTFLSKENCGPPTTTD
jgi:hypothetical protein